MKINENLNCELFAGARPNTFEFARKLRKELTEAELLLWKKLRDRKLGGAKFRRQHPMKQFVLDFYCASKKLAVEIDGAIHNTKEAREYDENRTFELEEIGIRIIRFSNDQILNDIEQVLNQIREFLK